MYVVPSLEESCRTSHEARALNTASAYANHRGMRVSRETKKSIPPARRNW